MRFRKKVPKKRVFGFYCDRRLKEMIIAASNELTLPIYPVAEHSLRLGFSQVMTDLKDEESRRALFNHLREQHFLAPIFNSENQYDIDISIKMRKRQLARWDLDRSAHELVSMVERQGVPAKFLVEVANRLIENARQTPSRGNYDKGR